MSCPSLLHVITLPLSCCGTFTLNEFNCVCSCVSMFFFLTKTREKYSDPSKKKVSISKSTSRALIIKCKP